VKEVAYHVDHAEQWMLRLALGTDESRRRTEVALVDLWPYVDELFQDEPLIDRLEADEPGAVVRPSTLREPVLDAVAALDLGGFYRSYRADGHGRNQPHDAVLQNLKIADPVFIPDHQVDHESFQPPVGMRLHELPHGARPLS